MKYVFEDKRTGNLVYRHGLPNGSTFVRSFKTTDQKVMEQQWSTVDAEYNARAAEQRLTKKYEDNKDARRDKFWAAAARWMIWMKSTNGGTLPRPANIGLPTETRNLSHPFSFVRSNFLRWAEHNDPDALKVYNMGDMREEPLFRTGLVAAYFTMSELERLQGPQPIEVSTPAIPSSLPEPDPSQHMLDVVFERWVQETNPAASTKDDVKRAMALFEEANPDRPTVEQITRSHVQKFRELLSQKDMSNVTRNKRIAGISILMGQAVKLFWIDSNPTLGVKFEVKDGERSKRESFERADIKAWMQHPTFSEHQFGPYGWSEYWIVLLCLWHGARRNEIGQLHVSDLRKVDGFWVLNIDGEIGGGDGKKIKNAASRRVIPLHPSLVKAGFPEWVKSLSQGRMFENCPIEGNGSIGCISKFVREQLDTAMVDADLSLHCTRHTLRTFAREAEVPEEVVDAIVGHSNGKQGRKYGSVPLKTMAKALARINLGAQPKPYAA